MMMAMSRPCCQSIAATSCHGVKRHEEDDDMRSSRRRPNMDGAGRYSQTTTTHIGGGTECSYGSNYGQLPYAPGSLGVLCVIIYS
jgi:hypothetical protein